MAGIGDYKKKAKGSRGFKMKGFSYPGKSPLKGKAERMAEQEALTTSAQDKIDKFGEMKMEGTNLMKGKQFTVDQQLMSPSPMQQENGGGDSGSDSGGGFGADLGTAVASAVVSELVGRGMQAAFKTEEEKERKGPDAKGFSNIKLGKK
jgi:hypothetical protein